MKFKHAGQWIVVEKEDGRWQYRIEGSNLRGPSIQCDKERVIKLAKKVAETHGTKAIKTE